MRPTDWNDELLAILHQMWPAGYSCQMISDRVGIGRTAVLNKVHELGLEARELVYWRPVRGSENWPPERIELLKQRWAEGLSASQIGAEFGLTRNAIIGKVHRLGLEKRARGQNMARRPRAARTAPYKAPLTIIQNEPLPPEPELPPFTGTPVTLMQLEDHQCRWPVRGPDGDLYCGAPADKSWCTYHARLARRGTSGPRPIALGTVSRTNHWR